MEINMSIDLNLRDEEVIKSVALLEDFVRTEYNTTRNYLDYYADKGFINNVNNIKNQIIYGRRGTGKTHLLRALQETLVLEFDSKRILPTYIDIRSHKPLLQSDNPVYYSLIILKELIIEILKSVFTNLHLIYRVNEYDKYGQQELIKKKEQLNGYLNEINYNFDGTTLTKIGELDFNVKEILKLAASLSIAINPELTMDIEKQKEEETHEKRIKYISFNKMVDLINNLIDDIGLTRITCLIDEWSEIPLEIQPIFAELLKRSFISSKITIKIAAIPNRTQLINTNRLGLEVGGDIFGFLLDNRYIYELDQESTKIFFNELLFNHLRLINNELYQSFYQRSTNQPVRQFINQFLANQALRELLIASAGIPRDFLHVFIYSFNEYINRNTSQTHITLIDVRTATISWYETDKKTTVDANPSAKMMLEKIINEIVISKKRCHFLIPEKYEANPYLQDLIDLRVIHLRKKGISHKDIKGVIYNVYYIDYACYTSSNVYHNRLNSNLLNEIETIDNFRDIRRIALDDSFFENFNSQIGNCIKCPSCSRLVDINHPAYVKQKICHHCWEKIE